MLCQPLPPLSEGQVRLLVATNAVWPAETRDWLGGRADHIALARRGFVRRIRSFYTAEETGSVITRAGFEHLQQLGELEPWRRW